MCVKEFRLKNSDFLAKELKEGEEVEIDTPMGKIRGKVASREYSALLGTHNVYAIDADRGVRTYVKMQVLGESVADERRDAVSSAALAGSEVWGKLGHLRGESGPILVRLSLQRSVGPAENAKKYLRVAALARVLPGVLKYRDLIVTDLGPENEGKHPFDIYITSIRRLKTDEQITKLKTVERMIEHFGQNGITALREVHEKIGNLKYAERLRAVEEKMARREGLGPGDYKAVTAAFIRALHEYPKLDEFWQEWAKDRLDELRELRRMGVKGKTVSNVERYIRSIRRMDDWRQRAWHATIINKNMAKLWLYAMKRRGIVRSPPGGDARRRAGPSRRP